MVLKREAKHSLLVLAHWIMDVAGWAVLRAHGTQKKLPIMLNVNNVWLLWMQQMPGITIPINARCAEIVHHVHGAVHRHATPHHAFKSNQQLADPNETFKLEIAFEPIFKVKIISFIFFICGRCQLAPCALHTMLYTILSMDANRIYFLYSFHEWKTGIGIPPKWLVCGPDRPDLY